MASLIELNPRRFPSDAYFNGYRLTSKPIPSRTCYFDNKVDRVLPNSNQHSVLHEKLFNFHNHLIADEFEYASVYFIDEDLYINKVRFDTHYDELFDPVKVWQIPKSREKVYGDFNASMKFISLDMAIVADGRTEAIHILQTGDRGSSDETEFTSCFSDGVAGPIGAFLLMDAVLNAEKNYQELHVLLLSIAQETPDEQYSSLLYWITLILENDKWSQTGVIQLKTKGAINYAALEKSCEAVYIVTEDGCNITLNTDYPISEEQMMTTFNNQQVEDCVVENCKNVIFERINGSTNRITHKIYLGSNQVLMTANLYKNLSPAIGIKNNADICFWQPDGGNDEFFVTHEETLIGLGYIQGSKQDKKFFVCSPNGEYSVICEHSGNIFVYRRSRPISRYKLIDRWITRPEENVARLQSLHIKNNDILGIHSLNNKLFVLCNDFVMLLKL